MRAHLLWLLPWCRPVPEMHNLNPQVGMGGTGNGDRYCIARAKGASASQSRVLLCQRACWPSVLEKKKFLKCMPVCVVVFLAPVVMIQ